MLRELCVETNLDGISWKDGRRIVELKHLADQMFCERCTCTILKKSNKYNVKNKKTQKTKQTNFILTPVVAILDPLPITCLLACINIYVYFQIWFIYSLRILINDNVTCTRYVLSNFHAYFFLLLRINGYCYHSAQP